MSTWTRTADALPPEKTDVEVITDSGDQRDLYYDRGLWFLPDRSMYVYFTPLMWRARHASPSCPACGQTLTRAYDDEGGSWWECDRAGGCGAEWTRLPAAAEQKESSRG